MCGFGPYLPVPQVRYGRAQFDLAGANGAAGLSITMVADRLTLQPAF
jgi:hypothetical protein